VRTQRIKHEDTIVVELTESEWRQLADRARYTAEKGEDWTVVNMLDEVFDLLKRERNE
jgi:hypothetical protein